MALSIKNNMSAKRTLNTLNRNKSALAKSLAKVSSGMRINSAGDDASGYSISERMRVRIRALDQDDRNTQNGRSLLKVAEGGIQQQIEILRSVKQKVIDAANDTNTDSDRQTIQKEIDQSYQQMEQIAYETTYNGRRLLVGDTVNDRVFSWKLKDSVEKVKDSDKYGFIPDVYPTLDGFDGPFDIFDEFDYDYDNSQINSLGLQSRNILTGATPNEIDMDFSGYTTVDSLNDVGLYVGTDNADNLAVITKDTSKNWYDGRKDGPVDNEIDISSAATVDDALQIIANGLTRLDSVASATVSGKNIHIVTKDVGNLANQVTAGGRDFIVIPSYTSLKSGISGQFSGGVDASSTYDPNDPDSHYDPGTPATFVRDISAVPSGSGITVQDGKSIIHIQFEDNDKGVYLGVAPNNYDYLWYVGKNSSYSREHAFGGSYLDIFIEVNNGTLTLSSLPSDGGLANRFKVIDGISINEGISYSAATAFTGKVTNHKSATTSSLPIDLSKYSSTTYGDGSEVEAFIDDLVGKTLGNYYRGIEFIDTGKKDSMDSLYKSRSNDAWHRYTSVDLNYIRNATKNGTPLAKAFYSMLRNSQQIGVREITDNNNNTTGVKIIDDHGIIYVGSGTLRHYTVDFNSVMADGDANKLVGKGFRFYCASCNSQWFNINFTNGDVDELRPTSGIGEDDIHNIFVDVSKVKDAASLAQAIYEQGNPQLNAMNHYYHFTSDTSDGKLTIYDDRRFEVTDPNAYHYQEKGAKIADGLYDNVIRAERDIMVNRLIIQHTDKADMNIRIDIPQTTLDHIFGFVPGGIDASYFNVYSKERRDMLLGEEVKENGEMTTSGYLDRGIKYLLEAETLVGAQMAHMDSANSNIITARENTQSSESTIRDADMAKEMAEYTKNNVLLSASQSMLAQANQNSSSVLSLLQ